ncbi:MAG TPA: Hpt domain-containing protein [Burkholderiales bacterium]|nr:Hpt domain-containing protein [Burkholderiales bacterium]
MSAYPDLSVSPLSWVKGEIDRSLAMVREHLMRSSSSRGDGPQALATCITQLGQVRGALQILGLDGVTRFCEALEETFKGFDDGPLRLTKESIAVLDRAVFALSQFLDDLAKGELNVPIKLFPVYREINELRGLHDASERELFFPDLSVHAPAHPAPRRLNDADLGKFVSAHRSLYQRGLLAWLQAPANRQGLNNMRFATEALHQVAAQLPGTQPLWWTATAFIEALTQTKPGWLAQFKPLVSRVDRFMRDWVDGRAPDPQTLQRELLYALAYAEPVSRRIREVKGLYQLDSQLPEYGLSGTLEYDMSKLQPVLDDMKSRLTALEDTWGQYTAGQTGMLARFREQSTQIKNMAKDLGAYRISKLLDVVVLIASKLPDPYPPQHETLMLEMGAAFVLVENMLDTFTSPSADIEQQVTVMVGWLLDAVKPRDKGKPAPPALRDDVTQRTHLKLIHAQVAKEIISNLQQIEQVIDSVARDPGQRDNLATVPGFIRQVRGALDILRLHRAKEVLSQCDELIERCARSDNPSFKQDLEWLAEGLSCLGFYMDEMGRGQFASEEVLDFFLERFARRPLLTVAGAEAATALVPPAPPTSPPDLAPPSPQPPPAPAVEPAAAPAVSAPALDAGDAASESAELLGVFIEEAHEVLATIESNMAQLQEAPDDVDALTIIRRGFHTLKGSGRMVGLTDLGEFAWEIEQTLNQWLREIRPADAGLIELIVEAKRLFAESVAELEAGATPALERRDAIVALAQRLRGGEAAPAAAPAEPEPPAEVVIGAIRMSATLFDIYCREAASHLATLRTEFAAWREPPGTPIQHEFLRAAHTLASSSRTTGFVSIAELASTLEQWLQFLAASPHGSEQRESNALDAVDAAIVALNRMLQEVSAYQPPQPAERAIAALQALIGGAYVREAPAPPPTAAEPLAAPLATVIGIVPALHAAAAERALPTDDLDPQLLPVLLDEAAELLPQIGADLRGWRAQPGDVALARSLARAMHTLKGSARMAGAISLGELAHSMESRIGMAIESGRPDRTVIDAIEADMDRLSEGVDRLRIEPARPPAEVEAPAGPPALATEHALPMPTLRVEADAVDRLVNEAGEVSIARARIEGEMDVFKQSLLDLTDSVTRLRNQLRETQIQADSQMQSRMSQLAEEERQFDPLEFDRYSRLQELARMMAESLHDISLVQQTLLANLGETEAALGQQARVARDLQTELLQLRSVPFATIAERLYRTVRQTARELGKRANLEIHGGEVEIDRSVLQRIGAPLEHMLRNSIAHGIETPEQRAAAGKPEAGRIAITLRQEGNEIEIRLADDGAGLNLDAIRLEAIRSGLLRPIEEVGQATLAQMIFAPGFSTAREVTETYGRGIGMDVVRSEVSAIGGRVDVSTTAGAGTTFSIYLPLSLAVAQAVLVRAGTQTYAIPATLVEQVQEIKPEALAALYRSNEVEWQGASYRFFYLPRLLGQSDAVAEIQRHNSVLLLRSGAQRIAVHVDEIARNQEIVLKNVGPQLARVTGIAGATVLGNGQVVLIINPVQMALRADLSSVLASATATRVVSEQAPAPLIMVVDDSLTVRQVAGRMLRREGYQVATAKDGVDALQQMQDTLPDLLLLDIEMPRMDGFELTKQLRSDPRTAALPIVIVTSRTADKHRSHALELGANAFFGKPFPEEELLQSIADLLGDRLAVPARAGGNA